jgi:UDP-glucose 4-epimerase
LLTALGQRSTINIYGTDYATPDGTCIRDYIHVHDLAIAHILGLEYLLNNEESEIFNLGNGNGFSVKEVIETARQITQKPITAIESPRREGDPPVLVGSGEKARKYLGWQPQYTSLSDIISPAWQWHQIRHSF